MARRALILVFLVTTTGGCPDLTRSDRRPEHRSGDDTVAPAAPTQADDADPGDDGVDDAPQPAAVPRGQPGPAAPNPLKLRPGLRPSRPVPRQPLRARPVPGGRIPGRPVPGRPAPGRPAPGRPAPSDVAPDGTER